MREPKRCKGSSEAGLLLHNLKYMEVSSVCQIRDSHFSYMPLSIASAPTTFQHIDGDTITALPNPLGLLAMF